MVQTVFQSNDFDQQTQFKITIGLTFFSILVSILGQRNITVLIPIGMIATIFLLVPIYLYPTDKNKLDWLSLAKNRETMLVYRIPNPKKDPNTLLLKEYRANLQAQYECSLYIGRIELAGALKHRLEIIDQKRPDIDQAL